MVPKGISRAVSCFELKTWEQKKKREAVEMEMCDEGKAGGMETAFPFKACFMSLLKDPRLMKTAPVLIERQG